MVDYDPLPPCVETARALDTDAPILNERFGSNVIHDNRHGDPEQTEAAFASADLVAELDIRNTRVAGLPMEPRVYLGTTTAAETTTRCGRPYRCRISSVGCCLAIRYLFPSTSCAWWPPT